MVKAEPTRALCQVIRAGRAANVPFTAVLSGPERTATDNTTPASTCCDPWFPR
jgi:hypothetical protein